MKMHCVNCDWIGPIEFDGQPCPKCDGYNFVAIRSGTAPDTSLWLGDERRTWLKEHGGIQPTIQAMIDRAMKRKS